MLKAGPAKKVTIYVGQDHQYHGEAVYAAILQFLFYHQVSGASVMRGIAGFGADHRLHTDRALALTENLPVKIEFMESLEKIEELLPKLHEMAGTGLIEIQETTIVKSSEPSSKSAAQPDVPALKREGKAKLMRIFIGENDKWNGKPLHKALLESMRANDIAGVTVYQGILGYGANRRIHKDQLCISRTTVPSCSPSWTPKRRSAHIFPVLDGMIQQGLVVFSDVDVIKYTRDYQEVERRKEARQ